MTGERRMQAVWLVVTVVCLAASILAKPKPEEPPVPCVEPFVGVWKLQDKRGAISGWLTVTPGGARRHHAPDVPCEMTAASAELRLAWRDGFRDVLRLNLDGTFTLLALEPWGEDWEGEPRFTLAATRKP